MTRKHRMEIRTWLLVFILALFFSGLTAIPAETELQFLTRLFPSDSLPGQWLDKVFLGVADTNRRYPFIGYGYDWLAFAHFVLAILFIGPFRDPVRNRWVIEFGIIACLLIIPFALIAGHFRSIPWGWRLIDCCFGLFGLVPLLICRKKIEMIEIADSARAGAADV